MTLDCLVPAPSFAKRDQVSSWKIQETVLPNGLKIKQWRKTAETPVVTEEQVQTSIILPFFSHEEYEEKLNSDDWTFEETNKLLELVAHYGLRFSVLVNFLGSSVKSAVDLAQRFAEICAASKSLESESDRRKALLELFSRPLEVAQEEEYLKGELIKISGNFTQITADRKMVLDLVIGDFGAATDEISYSTVAQSMKKKKKRTRPDRGSDEESHYKRDRPIVVALRSAKASFPKLSTNKNLEKLVTDYGVPAKLLLPTEEIAGLYQDFKTAATQLADVRRNLDKLQNDLKLAKMKRSLLDDTPTTVHHAVPKTAPNLKRRMSSEFESPLKKKKVPQTVQKRKR